jgi:hypothetical protein
MEPKAWLSSASAATIPPAEEQGDPHRQSAEPQAQTIELQRPRARVNTNPRFSNDAASVTVEADFMEATGTGLLSLMAATGSFAETAADTATDTLCCVLGARCRFNGIQAHLSLTLNEVGDLGNHAAHCRRYPAVPLCG